MYLNIINNIGHESKRKNKKTDYLLEKEKDNLDNESGQITNDNDCFLYYSVFYGDLTKNWIRLNH
tara:strand:+ start:95 stop:289 length:195 start_codon:yes stop_codon:yes gene_type:complete